MTSTTQNEARAAIYTLFLTAWEAGSDTPVARDNEKTDLPDGDLPWVRLSVRHFGRGQWTIGKAGTRQFKRVGSAFIQVYVLADDGTKNGDDLSNEAAAVFEGERIAGTSVCFKDVDVTEQGRDGKWFVFLVEAEFEYFEEK